MINSCIITHYFSTVTSEDHVDTLFVNVTSISLNNGHKAVIRGESQSKNNSDLSSCNRSQWLPTGRLFSYISCHRDMFPPLHKFSMQLRSGDGGGHFISRSPLLLFDAKIFLTSLDALAGLLPCMNMHF